MMDQVIKSQCPSCRNALNVPAAYLGKTVRCKHCGHMFEIRAANNFPTGNTGTLPAPQVTPLPEVQPLATATAPSATGTATKAGNYVSAFDTSRKYKGKGTYNAKRGQGVMITLGVLAFLFLLAGGGLAYTYKTKPHLFHRADPNAPLAKNTEGDNKTDPNQNGASDAKTSTVPTGEFPRRMLAITIHNYLYLNPNNPGAGTRNVHDSLALFAERWNIPKSQFYHLTDAPKGETPADLTQLPMKNVVTGTIEQFAKTSRAQDRIVIVFAGHAYEKEGKAYLCSVESDFDDEASMIPLDWFWEQIKACPAQEKLIIFDVNRQEQARGAERPDAGPMSEALENALLNPPEEVSASILISCSKDQHAQEVASSSYRQIAISGSVFFSGFSHASQKGMLAKNPNAAAGKLTDQTDPLPIPAFAKWATEEFPQFAKGATLVDQTPKFTKREGKSVPYNGKEPVAARFEFPKAPPAADPRTIESLMVDVEMPPIRMSRDGSNNRKFNYALPFKESDIQEYVPGRIPMDELEKRPEDYKFQKAVVDAVKEIRKIFNDTERLRVDFNGDTSDRAIEVIKSQQRYPAEIEAILREQLAELEKLAGEKQKQKKRWQANYDYVVAQLKMRIVYIYMYNQALANVVKKDLPESEEGGGGKAIVRYQLAAVQKLPAGTPAEIRSLASEGKEAMIAIAENYPNTPWALLAKRDKGVALGLTWQVSQGLVASR